MSGWYVTANDIKEWTATKKRQSEEILPQLVKRLVLASCKPQKIEFPSGDSVAIGGWDGMLEVEEGCEFVPTGKSGWEFGTNSKVKSKADEDYKKRTESPAPLSPDESSFVFVTSRLWTNKDKWANSKKKQNKWKDVKGINAESLQSWLERCPAVHRWFADIIGKRTAELWDVAQAWNVLSNVTELTLSPDLFLKSRDEEKTKLIEKLDGNAAIIRVKSQSKREAYGFILGTLMQKDQYTSRTLIAKSQSAWDWVMDFENPLILVADNFIPNGIGAAKGKGHHVILAVDSLDSASPSIELNRMARHDRVEAIKSIGLSNKKAEQIYKETKGYLEPLLRHKMLAPGDDLTPIWVQETNSDTLFSVLFATEWDVRNDKDKEIMASLSDLDYDEFEKNVIELSRQPDPPIRLVGNVWQVISKVDLWLRIAPLLARPHLDRLGEVSKRVLKDADPSIDLAPEERFMASIQGAVPLYSSQIKSGISDSLALLSVYGDNYADQIGSEKPSDLVIWWVRNLFENNVEAKVWYSLGVCLRSIAEAAPNEFLHALEKAMTGNEPAIKGLFQAEGYGIFGGCPHSSLLWSLELISWNTKYLARSSTCLAQLCGIDPGGTFSNRPFNSLKNIFLGWRNHTCATHQERLQIIEYVLLKQFPDIAWKLMVSLLINNTQIVSEVHSPKYRDWAEDIDRDVLQRNFYEYIGGLVELLFREIDKKTGKRLPDLLDNFRSYTKEQQEAFLAKLTDIDANSLENEDREGIVNKIRLILSSHREFPDAKWTWAEELLNKLEDVYHHFEFGDIIQKNTYLFDDHCPALIRPIKRKETPYSEQIKIIDAKRIAVIEEIFDTLGIEGISELALSCKYPGTIGFVLYHSKVSEQVLSSILNWIGSEGPLSVLAKSYISDKSCKDWDWAQCLLDENQEWNTEKKVSMLLSMPVIGKTFDLVEKQSHDVQQKYWKDFENYFRTETGRVPYVARKLLGSNRPLAAVDLVADLFWGKKETNELESSLVAEILIKIVMAPGDIDRISIQDVRHDMLKAIEFIQTRADLPVEIITQIEWEYLPILHFEEISPQYLSEKIAKEPSFFVQLVSWLYPLEEGKASEENLSDELKSQRAEKAFELLNNISVLPGSDGESINSDKLNEWVAQAREMLGEAGQLEVGDIQIGTYLSSCSKGIDGIWPHEAVRDVIERVRSAELDQNIQIGKSNSRGVTSRSMYEGGEQERELTENYEEDAKKIELLYPRTAEILRCLAGSYERFGRRADWKVELDE